MPRKQLFPQQSGHHQQQYQQTNGDPEGGGTRLQRFVADVDEGKGPGNDADGRGQQVRGKGDAGQPEGVVDQVVRHGGDQPQNNQQQKSFLSVGHLQSALPLGTQLLLHQALHLASADVSCQQEHQRTVEHRSDEGVDAAPPQAEQQPAGQRQHRHREEKGGQQNKQPNVEHRRPASGLLQRLLELLRRQPGGQLPGQRGQCNQQHKQHGRFLMFHGIPLC